MKELKTKIKKSIFIEDKNIIEELKCKKQFSMFYKQII